MKPCELIIKIVLITGIMACFAVYLVTNDLDWLACMNFNGIVFLHYAIIGEIRNK
jgi:hypothetical protein